jgi:hypothetical protein
MRESVRPLATSSPEVPVGRHGFAGTWLLNLGRSTIPPITKKQVLSIETDGVHVAMREEIVNDKDESLIISVEGKLDGRDYPVTGTPFADTVAYRLLNPRTMEGVAKKGGRVCVRETARLDESGDVVRVTYVTYDDKGHPHTSCGLFERSEQS